MTNLEKVKNEGEKKFNEKFVQHCSDGDILGKDIGDEVKEAKLFLSSHALAIEIAILQDDIEELEEILKTYPYEYQINIKKPLQSLIDIKKEKLTKLLK